ncbi:MAG: hypothetical protein M3Y31_03595 [Gemmatimonadota bacterium]|nr:hypothetical protein [Gemmatimonadota bacterium]
MSEWSSAVTQVPAELLLADGSMLRGDLHVQARSRHGARAETPTEFLNRSEPFFAITGRDGGVLLIARAQVAVVTVASRHVLEPPDRDRMEAAVALELAVTLAGGSELRGRARAELPPGSSRAIDYLNAAGPFFVLAADDDIRFVNRAHVRLVRPLQ